MKAYMIWSDETTSVIFAAHPATARRRGAEELGIKFEEVSSCRRASEYDQYLATGLPTAKVLIERHNWGFECGFCYENVDQHTESPAYDECEHAYCSPECLAKDHARTAADKAEKEALNAAALAAWPGVTVCWLAPSRQEAALRCPGAAGIAMWKVGEGGVSCQPHDVAAWDAFKATIKPGT